MSNLLGKTLGKYKLSELLGKGGMAEVYKAYHPKLERYVTIKVLYSYLAEGEDFIARFEREARAVASLRHPHIVQIYDFDIENDQCYMVMEFIDGGTLQNQMIELVKSNAFMPAQQILNIMHQVAEALDFAHKKGIIHRDIKPSNILMDSAGNAYLSDFGIAHMMSGTQFTATGTLIGTPTYMSPEQGRGEQLTAVSDIYSLGIILYELLSGKVPFSSDTTPLAVIYKHIHDPLPNPRLLRPDLSEDIENLLLKALAKDPQERYQSANEIVRALENALTPELMAELDAAQRQASTALPGPTNMLEKETIAGEYPGIPAQAASVEPAKTQLAPALDTNESTMVDQNQPAEDVASQALPEPTIEAEKPPEIAPISAHATLPDKEQLGADSTTPPVLNPAAETEPTPPIDQMVAGNITVEAITESKKKSFPRSWLFGIIFLVVLLIAGGLALRFLKTPPTALVVPPTRTFSSSPTQSIVLPPISTSIIATPTVPVPVPVKPSLIIRITSSSDWAMVTFDGSNRIVSRNRIAVGGVPLEINSDGQSISLNQDLFRAYAGHQISTSFEVYIKDLNLSPKLALSVDSGCLGQIEVVILNTVVESPVEVYRQTKAGCHKIAFSVPSELLMMESPPVISNLEPPRPAIPSQADNDESKIVTVCPDTQPPHQQLCMILFHSGRLVRLTENFNYAFVLKPMWSGDGSQIYFFAQPTADAPWSTYMINADGSGEVKLLNPEQGSWSPDNQMIAYSTEPSVLRFMHPDRSGRTYYDLPGVKWPGFIRWSPDSTRLAFFDLYDFANVPPSLWIINQDGTDLHRIYQFNTPIWNIEELAWSPDGNVVGIWYQVTEKDNLLSFLIETRRISDLQIIEWEPPVWWTPSFWPQWGQ